MNGVSQTGGGGWLRGKGHGRTGGDSINVQAIERVLHHEDLHRVQRSMYMRIMLRECSESTCHSTLRTLLASRAGRARDEPAASSQQLIVYSIISSRFRASLWFITVIAVRPQ